MASSNPQRFLSKAGVDDELALEMFFDVVSENFYSNTVLWNTVNGEEGVGDVSFDNKIVQSKIINSGKSWQFIQVADSPDPEYHTPGTELLGQGYAFDEGNVSIDGILVGHRDIPIDQLQQAHWDVVEPVARGIGRSLAKDFDRKLFSIACQAAFAAAATKDSLTLHNGGHIVERIGSSGVTDAYPVTATGAANFRRDLDYMAQLLSDDDVPMQGRYVMYTNYMHRVLKQDTAVFDTQLSPGNPNDFINGVIGTIAGFTVVGTSNHIPKTNITGSSWGGNVPSKYQWDFTYNGGSGAGSDGEPVAVILCGADEGQAGIGYVAASNEELGPIYAVRFKDERRNTEFLKAQMMVGADILFPPSTGVILVDNAA